MSPRNVRQNDPPCNWLWTDSVFTSSEHGEQVENFAEGFAPNTRFAAAVVGSLLFSGVAVPQPAKPPKSLVSMGAFKAVGAGDRVPDRWDESPGLRGNGDVRCGAKGLTSIELWQDCGGLPTVPDADLRRLAAMVEANKTH